MPKIQNSGMNVPAILQLKLSVSVTITLYYEDIGRPITPSIVNWARIQQFRSYITACKKWEDPADPSVFSNDVSILQLLELVMEHLISKLGVRKIPLSYVTRADLIMSTIATISATFPYSEDGHLGRYY